MYRILFDMGPITIYSYGAMIALGFIFIIFGMRHFAPKIGLTADNATDIVIGAIFGGMVGARLYYVFVYNWSYYLANPLQVFNLREGGLVFFGGLIGGAGVVIGIIVYKKWPLWEIADVAAIFVPLGYAFGRIGCFLNGCCYGIPTDGFWGISFRELGGASYYPTMLYSSFLGFLLFGFALWYRNKRTFAGEAFIIYMAIYSIGRFLIEFLRTNPKVFGILSVGQFTGLVTIVMAGILYPILKKRNSYAISKEDDDLRSA